MAYLHLVHLFLLHVHVSDWLLISTCPVFGLKTVRNRGCLPVEQATDKHVSTARGEENVTIRTNNRAILFMNVNKKSGNK